MDREFMLFFTPSVICRDCPRLTHYGIAGYDEEVDKGYVELHPECWEHGFIPLPLKEPATPEEIRITHESIERFVVGFKGGLGHAHVLRSCNVNDIPGYIQTKREDINERLIDSAYEDRLQHHRAWEVRHDQLGSYEYYWFVYREGAEHIPKVSLYSKGVQVY
jgi:hypothetical protein